MRGRSNDPAVSIIVPTYNRPHALAELLESLARQAYEPLEIIVVNDAGEPVDAVCARYPESNLRLVQLTKNVFHVRAREEGLKHATGKYVMLCDDDDLLTEGHVARMVGSIGDADLAYSDAEIVAFRAENNQRIPISRRLFAYEYDRDLMRRFSTFIPSGCLYRRALHDEIGPFDAALSHHWDWDFVLRVQDRGRVQRVPVAGVLYAFAHTGGNQSSAPEVMSASLALLSAKHGLGNLSVENFFTLLEHPDIEARQAPSQIVWDGEPIVPRPAI